MSILENIYYGNIDPHEHSISGGKSELIKNVVQLETKLQATLTEQPKILLEQFEKLTQRTPLHHAVAVYITLPPFFFLP